VLLEAGEIDKIKLPSSDELELTHFIDVEELPVLRLERPTLLCLMARRRTRFIT
jgi:non-homologous end joining protein Ku